jgi:hypothetical protein
MKPPPLSNMGATARFLALKTDIGGLGLFLPLPIDSRQRLLESVELSAQNL